MIKYNLKCKNNHNFDAWFSESSNFEKQNKKNLIFCPKCNSTKIEKSIMAPNIGSKKQSYTNTLKTEKIYEKIIKNFRKHVEKNFENVGKDFPKEARKASKGERNEEFYGTANKKEVKELIDEGIVLWFKGPNSYTGEDMVELHTHGSKAVVNKIQDILHAGPNTKLISDDMTKTKPPYFSLNWYL